MEYKVGIKVRIFGKCKSVERSLYYNDIDKYQNKICKILYKAGNSYGHKQCWWLENFWHCECVFRPVQSEVYCI